MYPIVWSAITLLMHKRGQAELVCIVGQGMILHMWKAAVTAKRMRTSSRDM